MASRIIVERQDGIVTLRGTLSSALYREVAGEVANGAAGESRVDDTLMVEVPAPLT